MSHVDVLWAVMSQDMSVEDCNVRGPKWSGL